jgi:hypothetical protein
VQLRPPQLPRSDLTAMRPEKERRGGPGVWAWGVRRESMWWLSERGRRIEMGEGHTQGEREREKETHTQKGSGNRRTQRRA